MFYFFGKQFKHMNQYILVSQMNLLLDLKTVSASNIFFTETNPNMLFDGIFTKINYCDEFFTMYGIFMNVPVEHVPYAKTKIESDMLNLLIKTENDILQLYTKSKKTNFKIIYKLTEFLQNKYTATNSQIHVEKPKYLKISGIWENQNNEVGLSFKFY